MENYIKKIAVILPRPTKKPIGGYKVIYKYCDLLLFSNPTINIDIFYIHPKNRKTNLIHDLIRKILYKTVWRKFYNWFDFENKERIFHHIGINRNKIKNAEISIVTSVQTAYKIKQIRTERPVLYFIQGFEDWNMNVNNVVKSYNFGFKNIVVSKWLEDILKTNEAPVHLHLSNPVAGDFFKTKNLEVRNPKSILFMYHRSKTKGSCEAIDALIQVKKEYPDVEVSCFSAFPKPNFFPDWIHFHMLPTPQKLRELMNDHFIFLSSSYKEGFGLPPAEAMNCGCCILSTRSGGVGDFAIHNKTAYLIDSPPVAKEIASMISYIIKNRENAIEIANNGYRNIKLVSWHDNLKKLNQLINQALSNDISYT